MSYIKNPTTYSTGLKKVSPPPSLSLCHTPSLFLNEIMKNQVLNKIVCSMMESYIFIPKFFLASFRPSAKLPRHTRGPFASHQCAAAHRLKIAALWTQAYPDSRIIFSAWSSFTSIVLRRNFWQSATAHSAKAQYFSLQIPTLPFAD
jgi:hypothetical protein